MILLFSTEAQKNSADRINTSATKPHIGICTSAKAASSGTPKEAAKA